MDNIATFYVSGVLFLCVSAVYLFEYLAGKLISKYVREQWWCVVSIIPVALGCYVIWWLGNKFIPVLTQLGVLP